MKKTEDYEWSSARYHVRGAHNSGLLAGSYLTKEITNWRRYLRGKKDVDLVNNIRENVMTGRPSGDGRFVQALEKKFGRKLGDLPRGRPGKIE